MINFLSGIIVGSFLMLIIISAIYCFSYDDEFDDRFLIVVKNYSILIMITALSYCVNYFIL